MHPIQSKPLTGKQLATIAQTYEDVFAECRVRGFALDTRRTYAMRVRQFSAWLCGQLELEKEPEKKIRRFLMALAGGEITGHKVGPVTINQTRHALLFFYQKVRGVVVGDIGDIPIAKRPYVLPPVLQEADVLAVLGAIRDEAWYPYRLMTQLLYYTGARICDILELRVKEIDWANSELLFRCGKGAKDRRTLLPCSVMTELRKQVERARGRWEVDTRDSVPVAIPACVWNKTPRYGHAWGWY